MHDISELRFLPPSTLALEGNTLIMIAFIVNELGVELTAVRKEADLLQQAAFDSDQA